MKTQLTSSNSNPLFPKRSLWNAVDEDWGEAGSLAVLEHPGDFLIEDQEELEGLRGVVQQARKDIDTVSKEWNFQTQAEQGPADLPILESGSLLGKEQYWNHVGIKKWQGFELQTNQQEQLTHIGPYQLKAKLGKGGMGEVYLAIDQRNGNEVALKISMPKHERNLLRIARETKVAETHHHPHINRLLDKGKIVASGAPLGLGTIMVFERAQHDIEDHADIITAMTQAEKIVLFEKTILPVIQALVQIHKQHIHRDLKPANLLITSKGNVQIADFGLAGYSQGGEDELHEEGKVVGTPVFMSPEQLIGSQPTEAIDWYGLGATLFALLGENATVFPGPSLLELKNQILDYVRKPNVAQNIQFRLRQQLRMHNTPEPLIDFIIELIDPLPKSRPNDQNIEGKCRAAITKAKEEVEIPEGTAERVKSKLTAPATKEAAPRNEQIDSEDEEVELLDPQEALAMLTEEMSEAKVNEHPEPQGLISDEKVTPEVRHVTEVVEDAGEPIPLEPAEALQFLEEKIEERNLKLIQQLRPGDSFTDNKGRVCEVIKKRPEGIELIVTYPSAEQKAPKSFSFSREEFKVLAKILKTIDKKENKDRRQHMINVLDKPDVYNKERTSTREEMIGPYRLREKIRASQHTETYFAFDTEEEKTVCITILKSNDPQMVETFLDRVNRQADLEESHLSKPEYGALLAERRLSYLQPDYYPFYVSEYTRNTLAQHQEVFQDSSSSERMTKVKKAMVPMASALRALHQQGLVHLNIQPETVYYDQEQNIKVDGLEKVSDARQLALQAQRDPRELWDEARYSSQEQIFSPEKIDPRTDWYDFAATWFYLLTGESPVAQISEQHPAERRMGILAEHKVPRKLRGILVRLLDENIENRLIAPDEDVVESLIYALEEAEFSALRQHRWDEARKNLQARKKAKSKSARLKRFQSKRSGRGKVA